MNEFIASCISVLDTDNFEISVQRVYNLITDKIGLGTVLAEVEKQMKLVTWNAYIRYNSRADWICAIALPLILAACEGPEDQLPTAAAMCKAAYMSYTGGKC